jgi:hypothetical protein
MSFDDWWWLHRDVPGATRRGRESVTRPGVTPSRGAGTSDHVDPTNTPAN